MQILAVHSLFPLPMPALPQCYSRFKKVVSARLTPASFNALHSGQTLSALKMLACVRRLNLPIHCDGARIFNSCVSQGMELSDLLEGMDSASICLSKVSQGMELSELLEGMDSASICLRKVSQGGWDACLASKVSQRPGWVFFRMVLIIDSAYNRPNTVIHWAELSPLVHVMDSVSTFLYGDISESGGRWVFSCIQLSQ